MIRHTFKELCEDKFQKIPCRPGVYFVSVDKDFKPEFINPGTGGFYKCKDPNKTEKKLNDKWVDGAEILYIGKTSRGLRERIGLYAAFGSGYPVAHWGGRYIWQIRGAMNKLLVHWEECEDPGEREKKEIRKFGQDFDGKLPFANLRR